MASEGYGCCVIGSLSILNVYSGSICCELWKYSSGFRSRMVSVYSSASLPPPVAPMSPIERSSSRSSRVLSMPMAARATMVTRKDWSQIVEVYCDLVGLGIAP